MGLLDFLKQEKLNEESAIERDTPRMAMLSLTESSIPAPEALLLCLRSTWPSPPKMEVVHSEPTLFSVKVGKATATVALIQSPIPRDDLENALQMAWHWPQAAESVQMHETHLLVGIDTPEPDMVLTAMILTRVVSGIIQLSATSAAFWSSGSVIQPPEVFQELTRTMTVDQLPLSLWISFGIFPEADGSTTVLTNGMRAFEFIEIEIVKSRQPPDAAINVAYGLAHFMLTTGHIPKDGEDVNGLKILHRPSEVSDNQPVLRLEI